MERNISLDKFKIGLSVLVVLIHIFPLFGTGSTLGNLINWEIANGLSRIAVPCFFIISGYYLNCESQSVVIKYSKKVIQLYLVWMLIYLPFYIDHNLKNIAIFSVMGYWHLWYFSALLGGVVILFFVKKILKNNWIILAIVLILYLIGYYIQYCRPYSNFDQFKFRNFLFFAFPFLYFGYFLRNVNFARIKNSVSEHDSHISVTACFTYFNACGKCAIVYE